MQRLALISALVISSVFGYSAIASAQTVPQDSLLTPVGAVLASPGDGINAAVTLIETPDQTVFTGAVSTDGADVFAVGQIGVITTSDGFGEDTATANIASGASGTQLLPGTTTVDMTETGTEVEVEDLKSTL